MAAVVRADSALAGRAMWLFFPLAMTPLAAAWPSPLSLCARASQISAPCRAAYSKDWEGLLLTSGKDLPIASGDYGLCLNTTGAAYSLMTFGRNDASTPSTAASPHCTDNLCNCSQALASTRMVGLALFCLAPAPHRAAPRPPLPPLAAARL